MYMNVMYIADLGSNRGRMSQPYVTQDLCTTIANFIFDVVGSRIRKKHLDKAGQRRDSFGSCCMPVYLEPFSIFIFNFILYFYIFCFSFYTIF